VSFRDQHRRYASESSPSPPLTYSRAGTPTASGLFGSSTTASDHQSSGGGGSIALRAMRSVRSLARIRSWAYMKGEEGSGVAAGGSVRGALPKEKEKEKSAKTKEGKKTKSKKENLENTTESGTVKKKKK
jgi:serine/arginine repetitive matrix protein 2